MSKLTDISKDLAETLKIPASVVTSAFWSIVVFFALAVAGTLVIPLVPFVPDGLHERGAGVLMGAGTVVFYRYLRRINNNPPLSA